MYLSTLDSLVGFLWWVLSESLRLPPWGFFLFCPLWAVLRRFSLWWCLYTPFPLTPLYGPSVGLWRGFISFAVPEPSYRTGLQWLLWPRLAVLQILRP